MYRDRSGALWIGTDAGGLVSVHGEAFTVYGPREGLKDTTVLAIREDDRGDLWLGTEGGGLYRLSKGRFQSFSTPTGCPTTPCSRSTGTPTAASGSERTAAG
jgi:ligand-binding sensor domain-containing protein